jgi:hypothetical protein
MKCATEPTRSVGGCRGDGSRHPRLPGREASRAERHTPRTCDDTTATRGWSFLEAIALEISNIGGGPASKHLKGARQLLEAAFHSVDPALCPGRSLEQAPGSV